MGSIEEREITLLSSIRIFIDERIRNVRKMSQLNGRSRDDHRLEKFTHRSDKEIGIDAVDFYFGADRFIRGILRYLLSTWIYKISGIRCFHTAHLQSTR